MKTPLESAIAELWHTSRAAGHSSRYDRMIYVKNNLPAKLTEGMGPKALWFAIESGTSTGF